MGTERCLYYLIGSSRFVRERDREEPDEGKEEMVVTVAISQAFGDLDLVIEALEFSC